MWFFIFVIAMLAFFLYRQPTAADFRPDPTKDKSASHLKDSVMGPTTEMQIFGKGIAPDNNQYENLENNPLFADFPSAADLKTPTIRATELAESGKPCPIATSDKFKAPTDLQTKANSYDDNYDTLKMTPNETMAFKKRTAKSNTKST